MPMTGWTEALDAASAAAWRALTEASRVLLVTHVNPDGDAIGSLLGLTLALRRHGLTVDAAVDGGVPAYLRFLPGSETVLPALSVGTWDVMVSLDASDEERTGTVGIYGHAHSGLVINIDHHATNTGFGHVQLVGPAFSSTAEMLCAWFSAQGVTIDSEIATALLTGLVTDTLGFRVTGTRPETLHTAAALMTAGAPLYEIVQRTLNSTTYTAALLWGKALRTLDLDRGVIWATITQDALRSLGLAQAEATGLIGFLNSVTDARIAALFKELPGNQVELSLRAKPPYDVSQVAFGLGGGGHRLAAGATVPGTLDEVKTRVLPLLRTAAQADGVS